MSDPMRVTFARLCRDTRIRLDITQRQLAASVGVGRGYIAMLESGRANPTLAIVNRVGEALGLDFELIGRPPVIIGQVQQGDLVHARCSGYADRRLGQAGLATAREVEVIHGRSHGWIDLLAFEPRTGTLLIVEIKTRIDDLGAIERQVGWYERSAFAIAEKLGWHPRRSVSWLLVLASEEVDAAVRVNREALRLTFPARAPEMSRLLGGSAEWHGRGLAMIDPASRRRDWLIRTRVDGRRSVAPYVDYADAARRWSR